MDLVKQKEISFCLLAYSGHSYVVADCILSSGAKIEGYFDLKEASSNPYNLRYLGTELDEGCLSIVKNQVLFPSIGNAQVRAKMVNFIESKGFQQGVVIHKSATVSDLASCGLSTLIGPSVVVNSCAVIGVGSILNSASIIEHECEIGNFTHIAPGAVLAGNVKVGDFSFIGANSTVKQGVRIGKGVTIGAGTVVLSDVPDGETWVGNPGKRIK